MDFSLLGCLQSPKYWHWQAQYYDIRNDILHPTNNNFDQLIPAFGAKTVVPVPTDGVAGEDAIKGLEDLPNDDIRCHVVDDFMQARCWEDPPVEENDGELNGR